MIYLTGGFKISVPLEKKGKTTECHNLTGAAAFKSEFV